MAKFYVTIETLAHPASKLIEVEADDTAEAAEKAKEQGHRYAWIPWVLYGRPSADQPIHVTDVSDP